MSGSGALGVICAPAPVQRGIALDRAPPACEETAYLAGYPRGQPPGANKFNARHTPAGARRSRAGQPHDMQKLTGNISSEHATPSVIL